MIKKINGVYYVFNHDGTKKLSKGYSSKGEAEKRLGEIEFFKKSAESDSIIFECDDFKFDVTESEKGKFVTMTGTALTTGKSRNGRNYSYENLKENDSKNFNVIVGHRKDYDNPKHNVGDGIYKLDESGTKLTYSARIRNTKEYPDIVEMAADNLVAPSVQGGFKRISSKLSESGEKEFIVEGLRIPLMALVNKHTRGVDGATIDAVICESEILLEANEIEEREQQEGQNMSELEELKQQLAEAQTKIKEAEDMKKKMDEMMKEEEMKKKKKVVEAIIGLTKPKDKEGVEKGLMEKSMTELELIDSYEKKLSESSGSGEVSDTEYKIEKDDVIVEKEKDLISMTPTFYKKFNKELMESVS